MSRVVQVRNTKILLPEDETNQDVFIGLWLKAQNKAITKVQDEFIFHNYSPDEIDDKIDEYTLRRTPDHLAETNGFGGRTFKNKIEEGIYQAKQKLKNKF